MNEKVLGKPESNSDVLNKHPKTLLIGYGWVGQQVHKYFPESDYYTPTLGLCNKDGEDISNQDRFSEHSGFMWDVGFISTPSPMNSDGSCDVSYVDSAVKKWCRSVKLFIIRSTVTPGTVDRLQREYPDNLFAMQPEYVGETLAHPNLDVNRRTFIIVGGNPEAAQKAAEAWSLVMHADCQIFQVDGLTAEFCKYMENCFLGVKVIFVNEWRQLCEAAGVDYLKLREIWLADPRIGRSHSMAYRDNPGFRDRKSVV